MIVAGQQGTPLVCPCRANGIAGIIPAHSVAPPSSNLVDMPVVVACGHIIKPPVVPLCAQLRFLSSFSSAQQHFVSAQQSYLTPLHFILILLFHTLTRLHIHTHTHTTGPRTALARLVCLYILPHCSLAVIIPLLHNSRSSTHRIPTLQAVFPSGATTSTELLLPAIPWSSTNHLTAHRNTTSAFLSVEHPVSETTGN